MAAGLGRKLAAHTEVRAQSKDTGALQQSIKLTGIFQDEKDVQPDTLGLQPEINEFTVLIPVADETGFRIVQQGYGGNQFRLGPHFQTMMII